jgi:hypothetical protein
MAGETSWFATLITYLEDSAAQFPDERTGNNTRYTIRDAALAAFSVFFSQYPSFLSHQRLVQQRRGSNNAASIFTIRTIPSDNQIRALLDPVEPVLLHPVYEQTFSLLEQQGIIESYRGFNNDLLIALDGTWFHSSEKVWCDACNSKEHRNGTTSYHHSVITPVVVQPGNRRVISLEPEFIHPQDGTKKQDCENTAGKRWLEGAGLRYVDYGVSILGDDLYCNQPMCEHMLRLGYNFILTCKYTSHKYLATWVEECDPKQDLHEQVVKRWTGKEHVYYRYRFANEVPIKDGENALRVNWCELTITDVEGKVRVRHSFATNHHITKHNVMSLVEAGWARWKIENEHNNTLKTKGYNLEHNFGHGKKHLSNLLLTLNLLAFLFHTALEFLDMRYALIRKTLPRRDKFFHDMKALLTYFLFSNWNDLLCRMLEGLELKDPGG